MIFTGTIDMGACDDLNAFNNERYLTNISTWERILSHAARLH